MPGFPQSSTLVLISYRHHERTGSRREPREGFGRDKRRGFRGVCKCLRIFALCAIGPGMAFIVLRRSRNTRSYYLVESYRDEQGKTRRRTLCYLGREQDGTDTLAKAVASFRPSRCLYQKVPHAFEAKLAGQASRIGTGIGTGAFGTEKQPDARRGERHVTPSTVTSYKRRWRDSNPRWL